MLKSKLKKDDQVVLISGSEKGKRGKVLIIDEKDGRIIIEGINKKTKFYKDTQDKANSRMIQIERPVDISNVMYFCDKCKKGVKLSVDRSDKTKKRICKKCGKSID